MAIFNDMTKGEIRDIHELGLSEEQVKLCTDEDLTPKEVELVAKCLADGIPYERLRKYIKRKFSGNYCYYVDEDDDAIYFSVIEYAVKGLELGFNDDQISLYATGNLNWWQMELVIRGIQEGFSFEQIESYAQSSYTYNQMLELYDEVKISK